MIFMASRRLLREKKYSLRNWQQQRSKFASVYAEGEFREEGKLIERGEGKKSCSRGVEEINLFTNLTGAPWRKIIIVCPSERASQ